MYVYMYIRIYAYIYTHICMYMCIYIYTYMRTYIYIYVYTYIYFFSFCLYMCMHTGSYHTQTDTQPLNFQLQLSSGGASPEQIESADRHASHRQQMRSIQWPAMDSDALPSSYTMKVLTNMGKWSTKLTNLGQCLKDLGSDESTRE